MHRITASLSCPHCSIQIDFADSESIIGNEELRCYDCHWPLVLLRAGSDYDENAVKVFNYRLEIDEERAFKPNWYAHRYQGNYFWLKTRETHSPDNYADIDWEAEAELITLAFGIEENCQFTNTRYCPTFETRSHDGVSLYLTKHDGKDHIAFRCQSMPGFRSTYFQLNAAGNLTFIDEQHNYLSFARGLYHLGLLTLQNEALLNVTVSAHQKLEWELEYHQRQLKRRAIRHTNNSHYESFDWAFETERIGQAFGIGEPLVFKETDAGNELCTREDGAIQLSEGQQLLVIYTPDRKGFTLVTECKWMGVSFDWHGKLVAHFGDQIAPELVKGLAALGFAYSEVERISSAPII